MNAAKGDGENSTPFFLPHHPSSFSNLSPGDMLGNWTILSPLGRGGMGEVLHLRHRVWELELAAKIPLPTMVASAGGREHFKKEAETWIALPLHPHVVACHYVRVFDDVPVIFAEYVPGKNLSEWLRTAPPDIAPRLSLALQAAYGLLHAHQNGVIHQDIKPSNILVGPDGARITDFGIAAVGQARPPQKPDSQQKTWRISKIGRAHV